MQTTTMDSFVTKAPRPASAAAPSAKRDAAQAGRRDYVLPTSAKAKRAFVPPGGGGAQGGCSAGARELPAHAVPCR